MVRANGASSSKRWQLRIIAIDVILVLSKRSSLREVIFLLDARAQGSWKNVGRPTRANKGRPFLCGLLTRSFFPMLLKPWRRDTRLRIGAAIAPTSS
ncbi:MAG: hypothetical protein ACP5T5_01155 [Thermoprotei archaeon]